MPADAGAVADFLRGAGWQDADRWPLAGDASKRRYERLSLGGRTAILMIAPPELGEDTRRFAEVCRHLLARGLSAPQLFAESHEAGLLLLEDLGDSLFSRLCADTPARAPEIYAAAVDLLAALHEHAPPGFVTPFGPAPLTEIAAAAWEWYGLQADDSGFRATIEPLFAETPGLTEVLILRDFHAENLVWLPVREGVRRVGLLDFQDALAGHRAYDLVSLLEDARRDVPPDLREAMIGRYLAATGLAPAPFRRAFALLGAQRNLRILGIFARLAIRDGKRGYLPLLPRVWDHLMRDLSDRDLAALRECVLADLPAPDPDHIARLEAACAPTR